MHAAPRTSLPLSQPLQALPLGHPRRVSEDGKWVRESCPLIEGSTLDALTAIVLPMQPMGSLPISLYSSSTAQAAAASSGGLSNSQIHFC